MMRLGGLQSHLARNNVVAQTPSSDVRDVKVTDLTRTNALLLDCLVWFYYIAVSRRFKAAASSVQNRRHAIELLQSSETQGLTVRRRRWRGRGRERERERERNHSFLWCYKNNNRDLILERKFLKTFRIMFATHRG
jgi:hypothetical protein